MKGVSEEFVDKIVKDLHETGIVLVHTSNLFKNFNGFDSSSINVELTKSGLADMITDFLAELTEKVLSKICAILITLGGETSYKCCDALGVCQLSLVDGQGTVCQIDVIIGQRSPVNVDGIGAYG